jgi:hypothetical protein
MLIGKTAVAKMLGKRPANVRPDDLRDFPKPVIERPFPKWRRWGSETPRQHWLCWQLWKFRGIRPGISVDAG